MVSFSTKCNMHLYCKLLSRAVLTFPRLQVIFVNLILIAIGAKLLYLSPLQYRQNVGCICS